MNAYDMTSEARTEPDQVSASGGLGQKALPAHYGVVPGGTGGSASIPAVASPYLTTEEAAAYLRKSTSWLVKRNDIPFLKGAPNVYRRQDLDAWFDNNVFKPMAR